MRVLNGEIYFCTFFMWVRSIMLNTFALESSVLMLLNISLSNSMRRQSEDAVSRDRESSKCKKHSSVRGRGRTRNTRDRGTREKTREENKAQKRRQKSSRMKLVEKKTGEQESLCNAIQWLLAVPSLFTAVCKILGRAFMHNATPCDRKMETGANHIIQSCQSLLSKSVTTVNYIVLLLLSYL